ncbi:hypothetical protein ACQYRI_12535 [Salmonella enterica]
MAIISKEIKEIYIVQGGGYTRRFFEYQDAVDVIPEVVRIYGMPVSLSKQTVYVTLETLE